MPAKTATPTPDKTTTPTADSLVKQAKKWSRKSLLERWKLIREGKGSPDWAAGKEFEYLVIRAFDIEEVPVKWPFHVTYPQKFGTMEQLDGVVYLDGRAFLIESKDLSESAAIETVAKLRFRLEKRPPGMMAVLFSVSNFTQPTEVFTQFASPLNVLLWNSSDLDEALKYGTMKEGLQKKLEFAMEHGLPLLALGES